jgi:pyruvate carboxylase
MEATPVPAPKLDLSQVRALDTYWAQLRLLYSPFEAGLTGPDPEMSPSNSLATSYAFLVSAHCCPRPS